MSREVRRMPLDFEWPIGKVWDGYLMPADLHSIKCVACDGTGSSPERRHLSALWYGYVPFKPEDRGSTPLTRAHPRVRAFAERNCAHSPSFYGNSEAAIVREATRLANLWNAQWAHHLNQADVDALVADDRLHDLTSEWKEVDGRRQWVKTGHHPTAQEVNDWSLLGLGHDGINQWIVCRAEAVRLGIVQECAECDGEGCHYRDDAHRTSHEAWEPSKLPTGDGWQMWSTTTEGHPISPVLETPEALARWLVNTGASSFGSDTATHEQWLAMIGVGSTCGISAISRGGVFMNGVEAVAEKASA